jgi:hypothetical protein
MTVQHELPAQANGPHETVRHVLLPPLQPARQAAATRAYAGYGVLALVGPRRAARRRRVLVRLDRGGVLHRGASNSAVRRPRASTAADRMPVRGRAALALVAPAAAARRHRPRLRLGSGGVLLMGARNSAVRRLRVGAAAAVRIPALAAAGAIVAPAVAAAAVSCATNRSSCAASATHAVRCEHCPAATAAAAVCCVPGRTRTAVPGICCWLTCCCACQYSGEQWRW